jgi:hypothetical protein
LPGVLTGIDAGGIDLGADRLEFVNLAGEAG